MDSVIQDSDANFGLKQSPRNTILTPPIDQTHLFASHTSFRLSACQECTNLRTAMENILHLTSKKESDEKMNNREVLRNTELLRIRTMLIVHPKAVTCPPPARRSRVILFELRPFLPQQSRISLELLFGSTQECIGRNFICGFSLASESGMKVHRMFQ